MDARSDTPEETATAISSILGAEPETLVEYFEATQFSKFSPRESVTEALTTAAEESQNPWATTISEEILPTAQPEASYPFDISLAFATAMEQAMQGTDVNQALAEAETEINRLIEANELAGTAPQP